MLLNPSVSRDGKRIVYQAESNESDLGEIAVPGGAVSIMLSRGGQSLDPDWAPSGTHYLFSTDVNREYTIDDRTPQESSNVPFRSRGVSSGSSPKSPFRALVVLPLRELLRRTLRRNPKSTSLSAGALPITSQWWTSATKAWARCNQKDPEADALRTLFSTQE